MRQQALNLKKDDLACEAFNSALAQILNLHSRMAMKSWCLLATAAACQIFTGVVEKVVPMKGWLNIFNPTFTLHLLEESIAEAWLPVNRPATAT
ncbi:hypothetical protein O5282_05645 [Escherichia coli]|nr:hypothetical protein [Escherichia coli]